jgi:hypothetical protein
MDNDSFLRIAAEQHMGYIRLASQKRAERIRNRTPTLRDRVQDLVDCTGTYAVGSTSLRRYKIGFAASLRNGIGSCDSYAVELDAIMWCETTEGKQLAERLRGRFATKSCRVDGTPGDWFALDEKDCETLRTEFGFTTLPALASNGLMVFQPENFRSFDDQTPSSLDIRTENGSPLILIKGTGEVAWARTRLEKDQLISRFNDQHDLLLWGWQGQHRTDVFRLTQADLDAHYSRKA